jgi:hypothetical protein
VGTSRAGIWIRRLLLGLAAGLVATAALAFFWIGPRDLIGILRYDQRREGSLKVGDLAPDVALASLDGASPVRLRERLAGRPLVLVFGSFT